MVEASIQRQAPAKAEPRPISLNIYTATGAPGRHAGRLLSSQTLKGIPNAGHEHDHRSERKRTRSKALNAWRTALRDIPAEERASEAQAAIESLAKQEAREAKLKALSQLSDDELDKIQI